MMQYSRPIYKIDRSYDDVGGCECVRHNNCETAIQLDLSIQDVIKICETADRCNEHDPHIDEVLPLEGEE